MTMLTSTELSIGAAGILAGLGYGVVFVGLIALMIVVIILGKCFSTKKKSAEKAEATPAAASAPAAEAVNVTVTAVPTPEGPVAPGTAGKLKIHDVKPKTAAMLMAIVANQMNKPLNELRFISIKEVK